MASHRHLPENYIRKEVGKLTNIKKLHIVVVSGILLLLAIAAHLLDLTVWKNSLLIVATIVAGWTTVKTAIQSIMMKSFSIELLVTIAVVGAVIIGEYVEAAAVTFLFLFGAYLEVRTLEKTRDSLQTLMDMAPLEATILQDGERVTVPIDEVVVGDRIVIQSGEKVSIDGKILSGQAFINEAAITGESTPADKAVSDKVFSGTVIDNGYIEVETEKVGDRKSTRLK